MAIDQGYELDFLRDAPPSFYPNSLASRDAWAINDSDFSDYCAYAPPKYEKIIRSRLSSFATGAALDLAGGSNGMAVRQLLSEGLIGEGLVTNYRDLRDDSARANDRMAHIDGDILESETWDRILSWQREKAPEGFSIVMHRPVGGLQMLPAEVYTGALRILLSCTRPGGVVLTQVPYMLGIGDHDSREELCSELNSREDIEMVLAPKDYQSRPMALIVKTL